MDDLTGLSAVVIVDGPTIHAWQHAALSRAVQRGLAIDGVLWCTNTASRRDLRRHGAYYALAAVGRRGPHRTARAWSDLAPSEVRVHRFDADEEGIWQRLPHGAVRFVEEIGPDVVVKFGMGLVRGADDLGIPGGVLSYHHGDPAKYRGRPSCFYELLHGDGEVGAIVQQISDRLDGGTVVASGHSKVVPHSLRATVEHHYQNSSYLLTQALDNVRRGRRLEWDTNGENYRMPNTGQVVSFVARLTKRKIARWWYGATTEKRWRIGVTQPLRLETNGSRILTVNRSIGPPRGHDFVADPFLLETGEILCEALEHRSGLGRLARFDGRDWVVYDSASLGFGHLSYPSVVRQSGSTLIGPEMASIGPQILARAVGDRLDVDQPLIGLEHERLIDPTWLHHEDRWWLFAGRRGSATDVLCLWSSTELAGPYLEHPASPIVMTPQRARMAGPIVTVGDQLYRLGQNNLGGYGDGISVARINRIDPDDYEETAIGSISVEGAAGPHTYAAVGDVAVFDYYSEHRSPYAALRRLRAKVAR